MLLKNSEDRPSIKEIILNEYVQKTKAKMDIKDQEKEKDLQRMLKKHKKSYTYNIKNNQRKGNSYLRDATKLNSSKKKIVVLNKSGKVKVETPKLNNEKKFKAGINRPNIMGDLIKGKKISEILRENENEEIIPKKRNSRRTSSNGMLEKMMKGISDEKKTNVGNKETKFNYKRKIAARRVIRSNKSSKANLHENVYQSKKNGVPCKAMPRRKIRSTKKNPKKSNNSFVLKHNNKNKMMSALEKEYHKNVQAFDKMDQRFKHLEKKENVKWERQQRDKINSFFNQEKDMKNFHLGLVQDMDILLKQNDQIAEEIAQKRRPNSAVTVNQKSKVPFSEKKKQIKKDFGKWFTEDYFEDCLKSEGELGGQGGEAGPQIEEANESGRNRLIDNVVRDFAKKKHVEEIYDSSDSKRVHSLHISSNEKLPLTYSNGYTISNKRNKFGRQVRRILEIDHSYKRRRVNVSDRENLRMRPQKDFKLDSQSFHLKLFLAKLRNRLQRNNCLKHSELKIESRSKSCDQFYSKGKDPVLGHRRKSQQLRSIYLEKNLIRNKSCLGNNQQFSTDSKPPKQSSEVKGNLVPPFNEWFIMSSTIRVLYILLLLKFGHLT